MKKKVKANFRSKVFPEDCELVRFHGIIDPTGMAAMKWKTVFLIACTVSLFVDPVFLMVPIVKPTFCIASGGDLLVNLIVIRSVTDLFYWINIIVRFRTAYLEPSSRVFGRGELVLSPWKIAFRYLRFSFWIDLAAALPIPQVYFWVVLPKISSLLISQERGGLGFLTMLQFLLRLFLAYPLSLQIAHTTGFLSNRAWFGVAYNFLFILLASDVTGSCWYLLGIQRQLECWRSICSQSRNYCGYSFFDCSTIDGRGRNAWIMSSHITSLCQSSSGSYQLGIYSILVDTGASSAPFINRYIYSLFWGLQTLCSLGQNLYTSIYVGENVFSMLIVTLGLINFALFIGNLQNYLQSVTARLDEWMVHRSDTEHWMHHRQLPRHLRDSIRKYDRYKWVATQGIDEEGLLKRLPQDLQRQIKRHLCIDLVRRVPLFNQMDDRLLDVICERLKPTLCTKGTPLISEGDPVSEMLFVIRGYLYSYTTLGGRAGFYNSSEVGPGDFCGEELLTWALDPPLHGTLPSSTRTIKAITDVEAFVLKADDLRYASVQFREMHSRELKHTLRFYSPQWRTWAACFIQAAWRRHKKRKLSGELEARESQQGMIPGAALYEEMEVFVPRPGSGMDIYAARLMADIRRGSSNRFGPDSCAVWSLEHN